MLHHKLYYSLKPMLPLTLRRTVRRQFALRKRRRVADVWPILTGSERPPQGWPGWPESKRFAFVLTHDVEGQAGVEKCRQLMELEKAHGFRSSFNFIPEGEYEVSAELRDELQREGFEVGVHDLHHDGKLYSSRAGFAVKAERINQYLKAWNAVGFRSGFMLHNLEWLGDLETLYDASTFDTDPFEPQPDRAGTIFPFWVPRAGRNGNGKGGYVELPYTLPQDSTLFLILQERRPDIWIQKLDWVARHGGMALLNLHPDYLDFDGEGSPLRTFPAKYYEELLRYVRVKYDDSFWHPLPKEMAAFAAKVKPSRPEMIVGQQGIVKLVRPASTAKRICMVSYSHFLSDTRVMRYAEALAERGDHVDVVSLQGAGESLPEETIGNLHIHRLQERVGRRGKSRFSYLFPVLRFLAASSLWIARQHRRNPYDLLHIHNLPDFLILSAAYPRLRGARTILDIHDILPEFYGSKFGVGGSSLGSKMLRQVEHVSAMLADHVIMSNHLWLDKYVARTGKQGRCSVFINNVDSNVFHPRPRTRMDGRLIVIFPGGLYWHQGLDIAIRAFRKVAARLINAEFHIYGDGNTKNALVALTRELGLERQVLFFDWIPVHRMAEIMANADLGVVPKRADSFGNEAYSTKIMEFMSLGVPVVISSTKIDRYYFNDSVARFFESGNENALAEAMYEMLTNEQARREMTACASAYVEQHNWNRRKNEYLSLVDSLISSR